MRILSIGTGESQKALPSLPKAEECLGDGEWTPMLRASDYDIDDRAVCV